MADVVRELDAILQYDFFRPAPGEVEGDFGGRFVLERFAAPRIRPAADTAQEMQPARGQAGFHLDPLRVGPGQARAALQHDDIFAGRALGRTDDVERHVADLDEAGFAEPQGFVPGLFAVVNPARGIGGEGRRQVENAEAVFLRANKGEQIAQALRAERLEALGHQRAAGGSAAPDVVLADREITARVSQQHLGVVLPLDHAVIAQIVLRLDADADKVRLDQAGRGNNVRQQLGRAGRAHAGQVGRQIAAFVPKCVATGAVREEQFVAVLDVARRLDRRPKLRYQFVLLLLFGAFQFINHRVRPGGDTLVRMRAEAVQVGRAQGHRINLFVRQRLDERERPIHPLEQLAQNGLAQLARNPRVSGQQLRARRGVASRTQRLDDARLQGGRSRRSQKSGDGGDNRGVQGAHAKQIDRDLTALIVREARILEAGAQRGDDRLQVGF